MNHFEVWNNAKSIEPETTRFVETVDQLPSDIPPWLIPVHREDGLYDIFVDCPPELSLPQSEFLIELTPHAVTAVFHQGTLPVPLAAIHAIASLRNPHPATVESFLRYHPAKFYHNTVRGLREMNPFELRGYQYEVDPQSNLNPEQFWLVEAMRTFSNGVA